MTRRAKAIQVFQVMDNGYHQSAFLIYHDIAFLVVLGFNLYNTHASFLLTLLPSKRAVAPPLYLPVYFPYEIMFIKIMFPRRKEKGNRIFFGYFIVSQKME